MTDKPKKPILSYDFWVSLFFVLICVVVVGLVWGVCSYFSLGEPSGVLEREGEINPEMCLKTNYVSKAEYGERHPKADCNAELCCTFSLGGSFGGGPCKTATCYRREVFE